MTEPINSQENNELHGILILFAIIIATTFLFIFTQPTSTPQQGVAVVVSPTLTDEPEALEPSPTLEPETVEASPLPEETTRPAGAAALPTRPTSTPLVVPDILFGPTSTPMGIPTERQAQVLSAHLTVTQITANNAATETAAALISPTAEPTAAAPVEATADEEQAAAPDATGTPVTEGEFTAAMVAEGADLFNGTCVACHGVDARGIPGVGKDLVEGEFSTTASNEELANVIIHGRMPGDPLNTTGVPMPAMGGNPSLTEEDVQSIVAYIRSLQQQ